MKVAVIGAGLYGRYTADLFKRYGHHVTIIADDDSLEINCNRRNCASLINQARVHNGYHYPRSIATAKQSSANYRRFSDEYRDALIEFDQFYAIPKRGSLTDSKQFEKFCERANLPLINRDLPFVDYRSIDKTYLTDENAIDTVKMMHIAKDKYQYDRIVIDEIIGIDKVETIDSFVWRIETSRFRDEFELIVNCTYAGLNDIEKLANVERSNVKYEICEVAIFRDSENILSKSGLTIMDGQFVSFMPWSQDGLWSLTSVCYTPHSSSRVLKNDLDVRKSDAKAEEMKQQLKKYVKPEIVDQLIFEDSKFVVKTISLDAENDDNRLINVRYLKDDRFVSVLGGKLDAVFELDKAFLDKGVL